jgi:hypothetical protein
VWTEASPPHRAKWSEKRVKFKHALRHKPFNYGVSMKDATQHPLCFLSIKLLRFEACGAWERTHNTYVSRIFLVPKPGVNKWCLIINLRELNT